MLKSFPLTTPLLTCRPVHSNLFCSGLSVLLRLTGECPLLSGRWAYSLAVALATVHAQAALSHADAFDLQTGLQQPVPLEFEHPVVTVLVGCAVAVDLHLVV